MEYVMLQETGAMDAVTGKRNTGRSVEGTGRVWNQSFSGNAGFLCYTVLNIQMFLPLKIRLVTSTSVKEQKQSLWSRRKGKEERFLQWGGSTSGKCPPAQSRRCLWSSRTGLEGSSEIIKKGLLVFDQVVQ